MPPPPPEPEPHPPTPEWVEPPAGVVPSVSTQQAVVFRTDRALLVIRQFDVYPNGLEFVIDLRVRPVSEDLWDTPWELHWRTLRRGGERAELPDEFLRLGVRFADGTTWTNVGHGHRPYDEEPTGPVVVGRGGGGGGDRWHMRYWMWPLPPPGDLTVYAAWPMFGIDETSVVLDATALREDAERAQIVWD